MKRNLLLVGLLTALLTVSGCGETPKPNPSDETHSEEANQNEFGRDVNYPTEIPVVEEDTVQIHYQRRGTKYADWALWLWGGSAAGSLFNFNYQDEFGVIASFPLSKFGDNIDKVGFIVRKKDSWTKDVGEDRFIKLNTLTKDKNGVYHIYIFQGDANIYTTPDKVVQDDILDVLFYSPRQIMCNTNNQISKFEIYENGVKIAEQESNLKGFMYKFPEGKEGALDKAYTVKVTFKDSNKVVEAPVSVRKLYASKDFNDKYYYDGELGALYSKDKTTFKVWSPVSGKITLKVYNSGTPKNLGANGDDTIYKEVEMTKAEKGVFEATINGDLDGKYYTYTVYNGGHPNGVEITDPYAKSTGVNGLRGMVVNFDKTNPTGWENISAHQYDRKQLTVWETHVADVTSSKTWTGSESNRKKFLGLVEEGTTYTENGVTVKTGFDHIKELGVNAVQLIPIFDQANDELHPSFNWGYNPSNYNTLEGVYSSNPHDGYARIKEFKEVVKDFNDAGINIIMDVVYNHVNGIDGSNFDALMPGYYFRYDGSNNAYNGSGCGNETASENAMVRKFMIDSATFWAKEYKLGGFRFDLMGLHDIETMNLLTKACKQINPNIAIYGEPWTGGTSGLSSSEQAKQDNGNKFEGFGQFNDQMRDGLVKGGLNSPKTKSWISNTSKVSDGDVEQIVNGIKGITKSGSVEIKDPDITVNYVTCHDNYTLYDRFKAAGVTDEALLKKMNMLANSVVFTSQATTFMLAGEEMLRTKKGNSNSYDSSYEVNELNYSLKAKNLDMFKNYQKLISLKKSVDGLHLDKTKNANMKVEALNGNTVFKYTVKDSKANKEYVIIHRNGVNANDSFKVDLTGYSLYLDTLNEIKDGTALGSINPHAFQTIIAVKDL